MQLEVGQEPIVVVEQGEGGLDALADLGISKLLGHVGAVGFGGDLLAEGGQGVLAGGVLDMGEQLGALAHEVAAPAPTVPGGPHLPRVDVGHGQQAAAQEPGDLVRIDLVVLGLAPVDRLPVERVAQDEGDSLLGAEVGNPMPGEDALDGHHDVLAVRSDDGQKVLGGGGAVAMDAHRAFRVQDANVHAPGVQIDPTVVWVLVGVEALSRSPVISTSPIQAARPNRANVRPMLEGTGCLIVVPRDQLERYDRLTAHFLSDAKVQVRLDGRRGDRAISTLELWAIGGGPLSPALRAYIEERIRSMGAS